MRELPMWRSTSCTGSPIWWGTQSRVQVLGFRVYGLIPNNGESHGEEHGKLNGDIKIQIVGG